MNLIILFYYSGSGLVFIDPAALRRTTNHPVTAAQEPATMAATASSLARAFGIILRQVCQLFNTVNEMYANGTLHNLNITYQEANELHVSALIRCLFFSFFKRKILNRFHYGCNTN